MNLPEVVERLAAAMSFLPDRMVAVVPPEVYQEFVDQGGIRVRQVGKVKHRREVGISWKGTNLRVRVVCREDCPPGQVRLLSIRDLRS